LGDIQSELGLARLYEQGLGVVKSPKLALRYYEKAMLRGNQVAETRYKLLVEQYGIPKPEDVELPAAACIDGTFSFKNDQVEACSGHGGVKNRINSDSLLPSTPIP
jgi:TPR repeat protein